jgi:hypothetical protein
MRPEPELEAIKEVPDSTQRNMNSAANGGTVDVLEGGMTVTGLCLG